MRIKIPFCVCVCVREMSEEILNSNLFLFAIKGGACSICDLMCATMLWSEMMGSRAWSALCTCSSRCPWCLKQCCSFLSDSLFFSLCLSPFLFLSLSLCLSFSLSLSRALSVSVSLSVSLFLFLSLCLSFSLSLSLSRSPSIGRNVVSIREWWKHVFAFQQASLQSFFLFSGLTKHGMNFA